MIYPPKFYSSSFFGHPDDILTEQQARIRHETNKDYFHILKPLIGMQQVIGISMGRPSLTVDWVDRHERIVLSYGFRPHDSKLFLEHIQKYEFQNEAGYLDSEIAERLSYKFQTNGSYTVYRTAAPDLSFVDTGTGSFDAAANWEELPEFGEYDRFLKLERGDVSRAPTGQIRIDGL